MAAELAEETKAKMSDELITHAWKRIALTNEIRREVLDKFVANAKAAGFLAALLREPRPVPATRQL